MSPTGRKGVVQAPLGAVVTRSPSRRAPTCPHHAACGGCDLAHAEPAARLQWLADALARPLGLEELPALGFCVLGKTADAIRFRWAEWTEKDVDEGLEVARDVVRRVRAQDWFDPGTRLPQEPILQDMFGAGLVAAGEVEE